MRRNENPQLVRRALLSNASDAAGYQLFDTLIAIIVVTALGFTATQVGLLNALGSLSFLVLAVPIGIVVDAWGASRIILLSLAIKIAITTATLALYAAGSLNALATFVLVTVIGAATVASENAQSAIVPRLASGKGGISSFVSSMAAADRVAGIVAPSLAGTLAALSGNILALSLSIVFLVIAALSALRLLSVKAVPAPNSVDGSVDRGSGDSPRPPLRTQLTYGFAILKRNQLLLGSTILVAAGNVGLAMGDSLEPILVLRELDLGKFYFGLLGTIAAASGIAATFIAPRITRRFPIKRIFVTGAVLQSAVATLPLLSLLVPSIALVTMGAFSALWAVTLTITNIAGFTYAAQSVSEESLGRATAARRMITMGSVPLAALGSGALADIAGLATPLAVWPTLTLVAAIGFLFMTSNHVDPVETGEPRADS